MPTPTKSRRREAAAAWGIDPNNPTADLAPSTAAHAAALAPAGTAQPSIQPAVGQSAAGERGLVQDAQAAKAAAGGADDLRSYDVREVAKLLSCHTNTVIKLIATKRLPAFTIGSHYRIRHIDLQAFMQSSAA